VLGRIQVEKLQLVAARGAASGQEFNLMTYQDYQLREDAVLAYIKEGLNVFDAAGEKIGTVAFVRFGEEDANDTGYESVTAPTADEPQYVGAFEALYGEPEFVNELEGYLLRAGYIRIDGGLFTSDRFATPDQIEIVDEERVVLNVVGDELISL
jgi:hypothetical protein